MNTAFAELLSLNDALLRAGAQDGWINAHLLSIIVTGLAFYTMCCAFIYLLSRKPMRFKGIYVMLTLFFFISGSAHFISLWTLSHPDARLDAFLELLVAGSALLTAAMLAVVIVKAAKQPTHPELQTAVRQLELEIAERRKAEEALHHSQAVLRELAAYQERIREDERKRIAREIHDDLGQNLLALRLDVVSLHQRIGARHHKFKERVTLALDQLDTTMKSIRSIMNNLRPSVLDLGLQEAIEWQVRQFESRNAIRCELVTEGCGEGMSDAHATAVFRILQESLSNIGRHARASLVNVELFIKDGRLDMTIRDNGVGMYPGDRRKAHHFGLIGMQERVAILGGELEIQSMPGQGTVLIMSLPVKMAPSQREAEQGPQPQPQAKAAPASLDA
ncbi:sensor histidine kinase [Noviherbaspirillum sp. CPCC 100848]|uniref:Sensor histidine kinase n=1 Tax=Noviherbaspirillum album TaxID=3080276 RepID=A0ABU6JHS6_9BURK|nr:sensor histidine kinase [Noviherbaspirillum sp. CPCC 100848]MEC4723214.1 sensor histidine kinase [Noviherbaspirillum sp. CPCC 100848]